METRNNNHQTTDLQTFLNENIGADNCKKGNYYPDPVPVYEQLSIGWEEMQ
jgi:hypothetical protein